MKAAQVGRRWAEALKRYKYVFLVAAVGVLLLLWPAGESQEKAAGAEEPDLFQAAQLERKLEKALTQVEGAGEVSVVLTLDAGPRQVIAQDGTAVQEADKTSRETTSVLLSKGSGTQEAVRLQELAPAYRGALVVAQGGDDPLVRLALNQAVSALTGLGADQISICKGK